MHPPNIKYKIITAIAYTSLFIQNQFSNLISDFINRINSGITG